MKANMRAMFGSSGAAGRHRGSARRSQEPVDTSPARRRPNRRNALVDRLEGATPRLDLVVAPAGFGKTTVLTQWAKATAVEVVWLSCTESRGQDFSLLARVCRRDCFGVALVR